MAKNSSKKFWFWFLIIMILLLVGTIIIFSRSSKSNPKIPSQKKASQSLQKIIIEPTKKHTASVIFLHGLGNNAQNQKNICQPLSKKYPHIKFIIPQAPTISVSMNWGWPMPAWYNIKGNFRNIMNLKEDKEGLLKSVSQIKKIIQQEVNMGILAKKIIVIGHSQGAAVALAVGLTSDYRLAGIIALSGFLPCRQKIFDWAKSENKTIPFFLYHNIYDNIIPTDIGDQSAKLLKQKGYQVEFENEFSGNHFFQPEELQEILTKKLGELLG
ncbi:MAG: carboxylesterase [Candidatus Moeniiplasma glomeromycotorum]|nr:carboxylesterase [Candidatus Moeniiplasma glomeromycotorum]